MSGGPSAAFLSFAVAGVVLVALLMAAALTVALAKDKALKPIRTAGPAVKRWGAVIMILVGVWLIALAAIAG